MRALEFLRAMDRERIECPDIDPPLALSVAGNRNVVPIEGVEFGLTMNGTLVLTLKLREEGKGDEGGS